MDKKNISEIIAPIIALIAIILVWLGIDMLFQIKEIILPNPIEIFQALTTNFSKLTYHAYITMTEAIIGFILGSSLAIISAVLFVYIPWTKKAFYPYAIVLKATPIYALAPLLVIWFGNGILSKAVMAALIAFFPVLISSLKGFTEISQEYFDLFKSLEANKWQVFTKLRFPHSLPYLFTSLKISTTFAVVGATIAEFTGATEGIGFLIVNSSYFLDTSLMFAAILVISIAGIAFFYLFEVIEKSIVRS